MTGPATEDLSVLANKSLSSPQELQRLIHLLSQTLNSAVSGRREQCIPYWSINLLVWFTSGMGVTRTISGYKLEC